MKTGDVELIYLLPIDRDEQRSCEVQRQFRRRGFSIAPHEHGAHRQYGVIASKKLRKRARQAAK